MISDLQAAIGRLTFSCNILTRRHPQCMSRNSASGANRQRRKLPREPSDTDRQKNLAVQAAHSDPDIRLDEQKKEQSFAHLERTKAPTRGVGLQGWKIQDGMTDEKSVHDDVWDHFWGDATAATAQTLTTSHFTSNDRQQPASSPIISRTSTTELPKYDPLIPKSISVIPGKSADIVLKQDQGTGRTVNGIISQVLSRGDHPWGIKVRLTDGRVGRVQKVH